MAAAACFEARVDFGGGPRAVHSAAPEACFPSDAGMPYELELFNYAPFEARVAVVRAGAQVASCTLAARSGRRRYALTAVAGALTLVYHEANRRVVQKPAASLRLVFI